MNQQTNPLNQVMTADDIANEFGKERSTIRKYIAYHHDDLIERQVIRKSGGTWLMLRTEAERIWK